MYNVLTEIPQVKKLLQVGVRDYCETELNYIINSQGRVETFFDRNIKELQYDGHTWKMMCETIIAKLPQEVYISFDIDGLKPHLCPNTGTPVHGGFEAEEILYLFKKLLESGRKIIGFDLVEVGVSHDEWDENVASRILFKMSNMLVASNTE